MSHDKLAEITGYSAAVIQEVERGCLGLSLESMWALSRALKVSSDSLLFGEAPAEFRYLFEELSTLPQEKQKQIIQIVEVTIACAR